MEIHMVSEPPDFVLDPEPSQPEVREQLQLPPKSYADAAAPGAGPRTEEGRQVEQQQQAEQWQLERPQFGLSASNQPATEQPQPQPRWQQDPEQRRSPGQQQPERLQPGSSLHGKYRDDEARSDGIYVGDDGYRDEDRTPEQYTGSGMDASPRSPIRHGGKRLPSSKPNGAKRQESSESKDNLVYERFQAADGEHLVSVKPVEDHDEALRQVERERRQADRQKEKKGELVSGRHAGAGWERSSIRWAPLNVPLKRRLQTLMVLAHTLSIAGLLTVFLWLCAIPILWPLLLPYLLYVLFSHAATSGELTHRSERFRRSPIWSLFASYFPARLHRTQELAATRKYVFGYHPHGIISHGAFSAFATEALGFSQLFPGITNTLLTLDSNFRIPLYRDYALRMGLASVSRESCENLLSKGGPNGEGMGRAITIVIGGARESLDAKPGSMRLVLKRRKGFVKLAVRNGADLVPVLAFGENDIYDQFQPTAHPWVHRAQLLVKRFLGFTVPLFHARGVFNYDVGMMPYRRPINVVVGRPVMVVRQERPDDRDVERIHDEYVRELVRMWDEWKDVFARDRTEELQIVE